MSNSPDAELIDSLEDGFVAVPILESELAAAVAVCVIVRRQADPASGRFVLLRRFAGGRVLLGALRDAGGRIVEWLELWLQAGDGSDESVAASNAAADEDWLALADALRATDPASHFRTAAEEAPSPPVWIDLAAMQPFHPRHEGRLLVVCEDDAALDARELPSYSLSPARFAWIPGVPETLVALNDAAEKAGGTRVQIPDSDRGMTAFNPTGGRLIVRTCSPFASAEYAALLAGEPWRGPETSLKHCRLNGAYRLVSDPKLIRIGGRHFFSGREGAAGRLVEVLHLKLALAAQCVELVRDYVRRRQLPLLNVTDASFRVRLGNTGLLLPLLWTARSTLVLPGDAVALPIPNAQARYFRPQTALRESIFRPEELTRPRRGTAKVRLRQMLPPVPEGIVIEGTISTPETLKVELNELVQITLPLVDGAIALFGYLDAAQALAPGELGFRTLPLEHSGPQVAALQSAMGVIFTEVPLDVQVPLSTPCDLYSLGVLTLQFLFAGSGITLAQAKDYLFSLASSAVKTSEAADSLAAAIRTLLEADPRWLKGLGPHLLIADPIEHSEGSALVPPLLWGEVLATLLRMFPGRSPFAFCRDFGDAPPLALHAVFDPALDALKQVLRLTRSMHVMDWTQNREIAGVITSLLEPHQSP